jgi:hypothetical protein
MTADITTLDAHEQPSDEMRAKWKAFSKAEQKDLFNGNDIDDLSIPEKAAQFVVAGNIPVEKLQASFDHLQPGISSSMDLKDAPIYYHPLLPGQFLRLSSPAISPPSHP